MTHRFRWPTLAAVLVLLSFVPAVLAAGAGDEDPVHSATGTLFRWLNFALVFGGAGYLLAKRAPAFFRGRAAAIATAIREAARAKEAAEQRLREAEEKLRQLDTEVAEMRAAARRESAAEAERIRAVAREEAQKVERAAQAEIKAAERAARIELKAMAGRLAVERAEGLIRRQITAETEAAIFRTFLQDLSRSVN